MLSEQPFACPPPPLHQHPWAGGPAPTLSRLEPLPNVSAPSPTTHIHQLLWLLPSWCLGFNFCVAVRKLPIITALRGNASWCRPCSQLGPLHRGAEEGRQPGSRPLPEPPTSVRRGLLPSPVERKNHYQENPRSAFPTTFAAYSQPDIWVRREGPSRERGRAANRRLNALFYQQRQVPYRLV